MDFGKALELLKQGKPVCRIGWNGKDMWLQLYKPSEDEGIVTAGASGVGTWLPLSPHILIKTVNEEFVPWVPSQTDILSEDWIEVTAY